MVISDDNIFFFYLGTHLERKINELIEREWKNGEFDKEVQFGRGIASPKIPTDCNHYKPSYPLLF